MFESQQQLQHPSTQFVAVLALLGVKLFWQPSQLKWQVFAAIFSYWNFRNTDNHKYTSHSMTFLAVCLVTVSTLYSYFKVVYDLVHVNEQDHGEWLRKNGSERMRPRFFISWTTHFRFHPVRVKFTYPLLFVGFSTDFKGSIGHIFTVKKAKDESSRSSTKYRPAFFSVDPSMFANPDAPFDEKFDKFLARHGIDPVSTPHSYVATIPRFLNFGWCPSTCYYFYTSSFELKHAILEVNNTFGEKHLYLISKQPYNAVNSPGFTYSTFLPKDFHISPFAERSGGYIFSVLDPLVSGQVDVHVAIFDDEGKKTMTARFKSDGDGIDLLNTGWVQTILYVASWGINAFLAIPRTFWQAWKTYMSRKVVVTLRPEVKSDSGSRKETDLEGACREFVLQFLNVKVAAYPTPVALTISLPKPDPVIPAQIRVFTSKSAKSACHSNVKQIKVIITSPSFFTRFVSQSTPGFCFLRHTMLQPLEHRTILVSDWDGFRNIVAYQSTNCRLPSSLITLICAAMLLCIRFLSRAFISGYSRVVKHRYSLKREQPLLTSMDHYFLAHSSFNSRYRYIQLVCISLRDELWEWLYIAGVASLKKCGINIIWTN